MSASAIDAGRSVRGAARRLDPACVVAFCAMFVFVLFQPAILNDSDTLWQIRTGEWILDHGAVPATDPFSFTAGDRRWFAHEWLAETLMALAFRAGGMPGVMALAAGAAALAAAVVLGCLRRFLPGPYAAAALVFAFADAAPSMLARPHLLAWPCLALWGAGLVLARARGAAPSFALLPVMAVWVNLHGSFMVGLLLAAALMAEAALDPGPPRGRALARWAAFVLAACATALLNPDLLAGALFPFRMVGMTSLRWIGEWAPADFGKPGALELTLLGGLALGFSGKVRLPPMRLLMLLGLVHGALSHGRNGQLLGIVGALILAEPLGAGIGRPPVREPGAGWRLAAVGSSLLACAALAARLLLPLPPERTGAAFAAVLDRVPPALRAEPVLNEYGFGGGLIFDGVRPFVDSRADLYGDAFLARYSRIAAADPAELERALSEYGITWTIFPAGAPVNAALDREPGWRRLVAEHGLVVHVREGRPAS